MTFRKSLCLTDPAWIRETRRCKSAAKSVEDLRAYLEIWNFACPVVECAAKSWVGHNIIDCVETFISLDDAVAEWEAYRSLIAFASRSGHSSQILNNRFPILLALPSASKFHQLTKWCSTVLQQFQQRPFSPTLIINKYLHMSQCQTIKYQPIPFPDRIIDIKVSLS